MLWSLSPRSLSIAIVATASLATAIALAILGPKMDPVRRGSAEEFWKLATGVELISGIRPIYGHAYFTDDGFVAYTASHMHGSDLYRVREADAMRHFEAVKLALQQAADEGEDTPSALGFKAWQSRDREIQSPERLVNEIKREQFNVWCKEIAPFSIAVAKLEERSFWERWPRLKWFWANYAFEWVYLSGLALFAVWPGLTAASTKRWAVHAGLFPLLFMLPVYLGYAQYSYTSAGLSGGIVYPHLLRLTFGGRWTSSDRWLMAHTPQVFEPLSAPIGEWMSLSGGGMPAPTMVLKTGLVIAVAIVGVPAFVSWWRRRRASVRGGQESENLPAK